MENDDVAHRTENQRGKGVLGLALKKLETARPFERRIVTLRGRARGKGPLQGGKIRSRTATEGGQGNIVGLM